MGDERKKTSKITLRERPLKGDHKKLYLDIQHNGKRKQETLECRLLPPTSKKNKDKNKETMALAEAVRAKRLLEMQNNTYGFTSDFKLDANFIEYFKSLVDYREEHSSKGTWSNWDSAYKHLIKFAGEVVSFKEITADYVEQLRDYLQFEAETRGGRKLSINSSQSYFNKIREALKAAYRKKIIPLNPADEVKGISGEEPIKEFLYPEELKKLVKTACKYPIIKNAFLFGCQTGLRISDLMQLKWGMIKEHKDLYRLYLRQVKTSGVQYLDFSKHTLKILGEPKGADEKIFIGLKYSADIGRQLKRWFLDAEITKDLSFHCSRHTFAVCQLMAGTDIYTLKGMMGHRSLKTTEGYLKLVDELREKAARAVPNILEDEPSNMNEIQPTIEIDQVKCRFCGEMMPVRFNFCGLCGGRLDTDNQLPKV